MYHKTRNVNVYFMEQVIIVLRHLEKFIKHRMKHIDIGYMKESAT